METPLLDQGITLMLVGMGTVFVFLTILIVGMSLMSSVTMRFNSRAGGEASDEEIAVITAAIVQFRNETAK